MSNNIRYFPKCPYPLPRHLAWPDHTCSPPRAPLIALSSTTFRLVRAVSLP